MPVESGAAGLSKATKSVAIKGGVARQTLTEV